MKISLKINDVKTSTLNFAEHPLAAFHHTLDA
jgi:hypothetical protein